MRNNCKQCSSSFEVTQKDVDFYKRVSPKIQGETYDISPPKFCPDCRLQRRLLFRNENYLYKRVSDFSGKNIISLFSPDKPYKIYNRDEWWKDSWDGLDYGMDYDFTKPFFEQYQDLSLKVPHWGALNADSENSDYSTYCHRVKNCYLVTSSGNSEDCMYSMRVFRSRDCVDCMNIRDSEDVYQCIDSGNLYNVSYAQACSNCHDCQYISNCRNCDHCFGCVGLNNKSYYIFNKPVEESHYDDLVAHYLQKPSGIEYAFQDLEMKYPHRNLVIQNCESCVGDNIYNSKSIYQGFFVFDSEDSKWLNDGGKTVMSYDCCNPDEYIECYESTTSVDMNHCAFFEHIAGGYNVYYCGYSIQIKDCFGCISLKHKNHCILNKQYSQEQYESLLPKIIEHMRSTGEWGEFFPAGVSPFAYNETVAQEYFPLSQLEAKEKGFFWSDYSAPVQQVEKTIQAHMIPLNISEVPDDILNWAVLCEESGQPYRIIQQELEFYRKHNLPIPRKCPNVRHADRMIKRNPRKLFQRECMKCGKEMVTSYSFQRPEKVYCEGCYLREVY